MKKYIIQRLNYYPEEYVPISLILSHSLFDTEMTYPTHVQYMNDNLRIVHSVKKFKDINFWLCEKNNVINLIKRTKSKIKMYGYDLIERNGEMSIYNAFDPSRNFKYLFMVTCKQEVVGEILLIRKTLRLSLKEMIEIIGTDKFVVFTEMDFEDIAKINYQSYARNKIKHAVNMFKNDETFSKIEKKKINIIQYLNNFAYDTY